jgi:hypothetical protein
MMGMEDRGARQKNHDAKRPDESVAKTRKSLEDCTCQRRTVCKLGAKGGLDLSRQLPGNRKLELFPTDTPSGPTELFPKACPKGKGWNKDQEHLNLSPPLPPLPAVWPWASNFSSLKTQVLLNV